MGSCLAEGVSQGLEGVQKVSALQGHKQAPAMNLEEAL